MVESQAYTYPYWWEPNIHHTCHPPLISWCLYVSSHKSDGWRQA